MLVPRLSGKLPFTWDLTLCHGNAVILKSEKIVFIIEGLNFSTRGKLRNPIFGNILIALPKEI